jgi:hypothetical protein
MSGRAMLDVDKVIKVRVELGLDDKVWIEEETLDSKMSRHEAHSVFNLNHNLNSDLTGCHWMKMIGGSSWLGCPLRVFSFILETLEWLFRPQTGLAPDFFQPEWRFAQPHHTSTAPPGVLETRLSDRLH